MASSSSILHISTLLAAHNTITELVIITEGIARTPDQKALTERSTVFEFADYEITALRERDRVHQPGGLPYVFFASRN